MRPLVDPARVPGRYIRPEFYDGPGWAADDERGVHNPALSGYRVSVRQAAFHQRWQDRGPKAAGRFLLVVAHGHAQKRCLPFRAIDSVTIRWAGPTGWLPSQTLEEELEVERSVREINKCDDEGVKDALLSHGQTELAPITPPEPNIIENRGIGRQAGQLGLALFPCDP